MENRNDWGLTELGFRRPSYDEILNAFENQAMERFSSEGTKPNLTVRTAFGIFFRIWSWIVNLLFQLLEDVYNSQFVDTAVGNSLYQLGRNIGMQLLPAQQSIGYAQVTGEPGTVVPLGYLFSTISGIQFVVVQEMKITSEGTVSVPIQAKDTGSIGNVPSNTITQIINPIDGIVSVNNVSETSGGRGKETDEQFRDRYYLSLELSGGVNADAVRAKILQEVPGVLSAQVYENETDIIDEFDRPPHSIEPVVFGGFDHEVAKIVYKYKCAGIQTHGNTTVDIVSPQNKQIYPIKFTRPTPKTLYFKMDNVIVDNTFPNDGEAQIRQALLSYVGDNLQSGLGIGDDVIYNRIPCRVNGVPGVIDFDLTFGESKNSLSKNNVEIGDREKAVTSSDNMEILGDFPDLRSIGSDLM